MIVTFLDTETTGLPQAIGADLIFQPYIIEVFATQMKQKKNGKLVEIRRLDTLIKPPIKLPKIITKITGIVDQDLEDAPPFTKVYKKLVKVFHGSDRMVAHNLPFDLSLVKFELERIGKKYHFPYPPDHFCTVEQSMHIKGRRLKLVELHKIATGLPEIQDAHRASADVLAMVECYKYLLKKRGKL